QRRSEEPPLLQGGGGGQPQPARREIHRDHRHLRSEEARSQQHLEARPDRTLDFKGCAAIRYRAEFDQEKQEAGGDCAGGNRGASSSGGGNQRRADDSGRVNFQFSAGRPSLYQMKRLLISLFGIALAASAFAQSVSVKN